MLCDILLKLHHFFSLIIAIDTCVWCCIETSYQFVYVCLPACVYVLKVVMEDAIY